ncbi:putative white-brown complex-like protein 30 [Forsythia ovata]|uniref:White-brown complex-like protein 30 n=1 Tax=Forsythia ovata TaxID=205694 RepID=A0ABD1X0I6_9LAMI
MSGTRINASRVPYLLLILVLVLGCSRRVWCVDGDEYNRTRNPKVVPLVASLIYSQISNLTKIFNKEITKSLGYCINDVNADLNEAFNFASNLDFLNKCVMQTKGD